MAPCMVCKKQCCQVLASLLHRQKADQQVHVSCLAEFAKVTCAHVVLSYQDGCRQVGCQCCILMLVVMMVKCE